jgi:hypothetical protein
MLRYELHLQLRVLIEIKGTHQQTDTSNYVAGYDAIIVKRFYVEAGIEVEARDNLMLAFAKNFVFD